ncbi:MAG: prepilin-type N-terminal cleavage/methylation domain-containing protein [Deltaproteobacteria bacterium]|nr:prepilin-type N-terminal cleavage/methylation domain-containing protein [Deltaproteobacteria bacterium]
MKIRPVMKKYGAQKKTFPPETPETVDAGFTLVELMIAMVVGFIVLGAVYSVFTYQNKQLSYQQQMSETQQNARMAMEMMTNEIRMAGYNPMKFDASGSGSALPVCQGATPVPDDEQDECIGILVASPHLIKFNLDITDPYDGSTDGSNETITYGLYTSTAGGESVQCLGRKSSAAANYQPVVCPVESLNFTYHPLSGGNSEDEVDKIKSVTVSVTAKTPQANLISGLGDTYTLTANIYLRNLGI